QQQPGADPNPQHLVECKDNLRKLYLSLQAYASTHDRQFPTVFNAAPPPRNVAGLVYPILYDAKVLSPDVSVRCPGAVGLGVSPYSLADVTKMPDVVFEGWGKHLPHSYAYSLGYKSGGAFVGLRLDEVKGAQLPLMADSAPLDPTLGANSPHHSG